MKNSKRVPHQAKMFFLFLLLTVLGTGISACSTGTYGRLDFTLSVNDIFESGKILPDYNYFYIGPDAEPVAIIAIEKKYQLTTSLWKKIDLTTEQLAAWMERIDNKFRVKNKYDGAIILDQNGVQVGLWYSRLDWTTIQRGEGNQVTIFTPDTTKNLRESGPGLTWGTHSRF